MLKNLSDKVSFNYSISRFFSFSISIKDVLLPYVYKLWTGKKKLENNIENKLSNNVEKQEKKEELLKKNFKYYFNRFR